VKLPSKPHPILLNVSNNQTNVPKNLILLSIALATWGIGESAFFYFQPLYLEQLGASPVGIGAILGLVGIAMTAAHIPAGYLADRIGRHKLMRLAWLIAAGATWIMVIARSLTVFTIGMVIYGLTAFVMAPLNSYVTAARGHWSVGKAITLISASYNTGAIIGPLLGGYIGNHFGIRQIYFFSAIIFIISTIVMFNIEDQPVKPRTGNTARGLLKNQRFFGYLAIIFLTMFVMFLPQPLTSNFLQNERGFSLDMIGKIGSAGSLGNVALSLLLGRMSARSGYLIGQISVAAFAFFLWQGTGLPWYALGYFLLGGYRAARSLAMAQVRALVCEANMGLAYGVTETVIGVTIILAPLLAGYLYTQDPIRVYTVSLSLMVITFLISVRYAPKPHGVKK